MNGEETRPVNIGSSAEFTIIEFAEAVRVSGLFTIEDGEEEGGC
jgi:hypothetical protein